MDVNKGKGCVGGGAAPASCLTPHTDDLTPRTLWHRDGDGEPSLEVDPRALERPLPVRAPWDGRHAKPSYPGADLTAREIMTTELVAVLGSATVLAVAARMRDAGVGMILIVDERQHLLGVATDRDIVVRVLALGKDPALVPISHAMTSPADSVDLDSPLGDIVTAMESHCVRRLPVTDRSGRLLGVISLEDLVRRADVHNDLQELLRRTAARRSFWRGKPTDLLERRLRSTP